MHLVWPNSQYSLMGVRCLALPSSTWPQRGQRLLAASVSAPETPSGVPHAQIAAGGARDGFRGDAVRGDEEGLRAVELGDDGSAQAHEQAVAVPAKEEG